MKTQLARAGSRYAIVATLMMMGPAIHAAEWAVLFDEGHGQRFLIHTVGPLQLSDLAGVLERKGLQLQSTQEALTAEKLRKYRALVISGPFRAISPSEVQAVLRFLEGGGRLSIMLHIGPPVADLLHHLGVSISNGVIRETAGVIDGDEINFEVQSLGDSSLFNGIDSFSIYGAWALLPHGHNSAGVARTGSGSWVDLNGDQTLTQGDAVQEFSVIVEGTYGKGEFVIFGDDTLFQNHFLRGNNLKLAENLAEWILKHRGHSQDGQVAP